MQHSAHFNAKILKPITDAGYSGAGAVALGRLRNEILAQVMLRRTKDQKQADLKLPPLQIKVRQPPVPPLSSPPRRRPSVASTAAASTFAATRLR